MYDLFYPYVYAVSSQIWLVNGYLMLRYVFHELQKAGV